MLSSAAEVKKRRQRCKEAEAVTGRGAVCVGGAVNVLYAVSDVTNINL